MSNFFSTEYGHSLLIALPEFSLLCLASLLLILDVYFNRSAPNQDSTLTQEALGHSFYKKHNLSFWLANGILITVVALVCYQQDILNYFGYVSAENIVVDNLVNNMIASDRLNIILKLFMGLFIVISFYYSDNYLKNNKIFAGEYYVLGLFSFLGMMVLISAANMLTLYLGLELFSLPIYAMVAMQRDSARAGEAALKYFVMGAIASGILLFGISILYGMTGSLVLADIAKFTDVTNPAYLLGLIFICVGIAFKFGAAPFHMWMPDVYQGAPTPVALFIAVAPKLAAFGMAVRLLQALLPAMTSWSYVLFSIGVLSIAWGSIAALVQTEFKRLLAYSGISHMGFILLGLAAGAYHVALFYVIIYAITSLAIFGFILFFGNSKFELVNLQDYRGLYYKQPWLALMLMMVLFSMAGVPPFVGFFAKMAIIQAIIKAGYFSTAVGVVLFSVVGAFYYLKIIWLMFFEHPDISHTSVLNQANDNLPCDLKYLISVNCLIVLALGLYNQALFSWCTVVFN